MYPIADMLTIIRNGYQARLKEVCVPYSKVLSELAGILSVEGFIEKPQVVGSSLPSKKIKFGLKYQNRKPAVTGIKTVSKPGARIYSRADKLPRVRLGFGATIVSTPKGLMTDREARKQNLGGEVICQVW